MKSQRISGYPEWLPEEELVQQQIIDTIRTNFELHGYTPIRTRAMEPMDVLLSKGETDKEIFAVHRHGADVPETAELGLHYDLTVPFARYVSERRGQLVFPFRRYQIQPAWRGERPQLGRFREFIQADADVVTEGELDLRFDAEMISLLASTLDRLPVPTVRLQLNNRKLLQGFYLGLGIESVVETLRWLDKLPKLGEDKTLEGLVSSGASEEQARKCLTLSQIRASSIDELSAVDELGVRHPLLEQGLSELREVMARSLESANSTEIVAALHIARGFDYYTGTVVEGVFADEPELPSICAGGRYDELASSDNVRLPGVGVSIGISRMLGLLAHQGTLQATRRCPAQAFVIVHAEDKRERSEELAKVLRQRGIATLVSDKANAYGKQIKHAIRLGIRYVWFPETSSKPAEVRDLDSSHQETASPQSWSPETNSES